MKTLKIVLLFLFAAVNAHAGWEQTETTRKLAADGWKRTGYYYDCSTGRRAGGESYRLEVFQLKNAKGKIAYLSQFQVYGVQLPWSSQNVDRVGITGEAEISGGTLYLANDTIELRRTQAIVDRGNYKINLSCSAGGDQLPPFSGSH